MVLLRLLVIIQICQLVNTKIDDPNFGHCIKSVPNPGIVNCAGQQFLTSLHLIDEQENYTISDGVVLIRDESVMSRSMPNFLEQDPVDFRGILENAGAIVGQRTLQWDLGMIQPGLCLRIGPSANLNSVLEFIIDPTHDRGDRYLHDESPSTARTLAKQFLVPFLLGLKFNLVTILPLIFAGIILLCKKAAFLGKFALFITGLLGFGSLFGGLGGFGGGGFGGGWGGGFNGPNQFLNDGIGSFGGAGVGLSGGYYKKDEEHLPYSSKPITVPVVELQEKPREPIFYDNFYNYEKKVLLQDRNTKLYEKDIEERSSPSGYRNFAWKTN